MYLPPAIVEYAKLSMLLQPIPCVGGLNVSFHFFPSFPSVRSVKSFYFFFSQTITNIRMQSTQRRS